MVNNVDYSEFGENRSTHVHAHVQLRALQPQQLLLL